MRTKDKPSSGMGAVMFTVLALVFTGITAWLLAMMLAGTEYSKEPVQSVVVAKGDIKPLTPITPELTRVVKVPISTVPSGAFETVEELTTDPPARPLVFITDGEIILGSRLADPKSGKGLASFVPKGMRAMVVKTDVAPALARLITPGAMVDIIATMRIEMLNTTVTRLILQNVKVLAIGTDVDPAHLTKAEASAAQSYSGKPVEDKDTVVTLLLTPQQAEQLTLATRQGTIDVVLRSPNDKGMPPTTGSQPEDLFPDLEKSESGEPEPRRTRRSRRSGRGARYRPGGGGGGIQIR